MTGKRQRAANEDSSALALPRSPIRIMNILEELAAAPAGLPLVRLYEQVELPKTTVLSYLRALEDAKYVENIHGIYRIGEAALRLGATLTSSIPFPHSVHNRLQALMTTTEETVLLAVLSEDKMSAVYVDKVECQRMIRFAGFLGLRRPLYASGIGKALLAFQDAEFVSSYLGKLQFAQLTDRTITDKVSLQREIHRIQRNGYATGYGEMEEGVGAISAPIYDAHGANAAAVSIAGPLERIRAHQKEFSLAVMEAAKEMSMILGWRDDRR